MRLCIPTETKEGLGAKVYGHFGSAPYFTVYDTDKEGIKVINNTNAHHSHGMCHPIGVIGTSSIDAVVCMGMGARAVQNLNAANIKAFRADGKTVSEIVNKYKAGELEEITIENACAQHGCH
ncbi:MAG: NifB/NifX family molybdenum-iron cluster-binding protein [Candidatus Omnitrophica bacterium]|nr:NifB/NifX family molybdenum-iron cluster-binding protein [Candidatus Omnitrophota bacterium]